jgi:hypothetical protein
MTSIRTEQIIGEEMDRAGENKRFLCAKMGCQPHERQLLNLLMHHAVSLRCRL